MLSVPHESEKRYSSVTARSFNDRISRIETYVVNIKLGDVLFTNIEVIAISTSYGLIGRDILNQFKIILDAPKLQWSLEK